MTYWRAASSGLVCLLCACGGSEFEEGSPAGGGSAGNGGTSAAGGSGGGAGVAGGGAPSGGSAGVGTGGVAGSGSGGVAGAGGSGGGPQAISIVHASETAMTLTLDVPTLTLGWTPSAGNALVVGITCQSTTEWCTLPQGSVTDNQGNSYIRVVQGEAVTSSAQGARAYIFIAENIAAPSGPVVLSVDPNGSVPPDTQLVAWGAIEVAGLAMPPSFDASGISIVTGEATETTATTDLAPTQPNELAVAVLTMRSDDTNMLITPAAGWTSQHVNQNGYSGPPGHSMVTQITTSTDIVSHTWTHDEPSRGAAAVIATFRGMIEEP